MKRVSGVAVMILVVACLTLTSTTRAFASGDPSEQSPPRAPAGYSRVYDEEFLGSSLDSNWYAYSGQPGGDPANCWAPSHVTVSDGEAVLSTYQDPAHFCGTPGDPPWVSGGIGTIGAITYGEVLVRSRVTSMVGITQVELLWPQAPFWPPEVDFNESWGAVGGTSATLHYNNSGNEQISADVAVDLTQWHTWGVIWTPGEMQYTVDGTVWATMTTDDVPDIAMVLDIQQQWWSGGATPDSDTDLDVDWVAAYQPR
jgi:Glycosyl hydrolases family 16